MSLVYYIATPGYLLMAGDGRITNDENRVVSENFQKVYSINGWYLAGFTGTVAGVEAAFNTITDCDIDEAFERLLASHFSSLVQVALLGIDRNHNISVKRILIDDKHVEHTELEATSAIFRCGALSAELGSLAVREYEQAHPIRLSGDVHEMPHIFHHWIVPMFHEVAGKDPSVNGNIRAGYIIPLLV